jgi:hypothetical protein
LNRAWFSCRLRSTARTSVIKDTGHIHTAAVPGTAAVSLALVVVMA